MTNAQEKELHNLLLALQREPDLLQCVELDIHDIMSTKFKISRKDAFKFGFYAAAGYFAYKAVDHALVRIYEEVKKKRNHDTGDDK